MQRFKIKIVATNSNWLKEFLYFVQNPKGDFYYGLLGPHPEDKTSIHASGISHIKRYNNQLIKLGKGTPLAEFKGIRQLFSMSIGQLVFSNQHFGIQYKEKNNTLSHVINIKQFNGDIGISTLLIEPNSETKLEPLKKIYKNPNITIYKQTNPHLAILTYNSSDIVKHKLNNIQPQNTGELT
ncbi:MAG: hypothetical protein JXA68_01755 [Ignavibacteriales bacterium]|nr:hypothetical protein [Ignavibacteriales bacterium]